MSQNKSETNNFTVQQILNWAYQELQQCSDTAKLDAKILFRHVTNYSEVDVIIKANQTIEDQVIDAFQEVIGKRQQGEPVAYLSGRKEFWSLNFKVTPETLIPRPETELLVETALNLFPKHNDFKIADLGTGSGAIACALANERPEVNIIATDQSEAALEIAKENAKTFELTNIEFIHSDWFENLNNHQFDLIVSNPPYVPAGNNNLKQGDVRFEPNLALTPGPDGLIDLKHIIELAKHHLKPNGYLLLEHGYDQEQEVLQLFTNTRKSKETVVSVQKYHRRLRSVRGIPESRGDQTLTTESAYKNIVCLKDLNGLPRLTYAQVN